MRSIPGLKILPDWLSNIFLFHTIQTCFLIPTQAESSVAKDEAASEPENNGHDEAKEAASDKRPLGNSNKRRQETSDTDKIPSVSEDGKDGGESDSDISMVCWTCGKNFPCWVMLDRHRERKHDDMSKVKGSRRGQGEEI